MKTLQIIKQDQDKTISLVEHETTHTKYILQLKLNDCHFLGSQKS